MDVRQAFEIARELMDAHGLHEWTLGADRAKRRAGLCRFEQTLLSLSVPLTQIHDEDLVRDTILHEIAHALVGPTHGHDEVWRQKAVSIGCSGDRCVPEDAPRPTGVWQGSCSAGHTTSTLERPTRVKTCGQCVSDFSVDHLLAWTWHDAVVRMHPAYVAELVQIRGRHGSSTGLEQQLEDDRLVGGGEAHPAVQGRLGQRLGPGTPVRVAGGRGQAPLLGRVVSFGKTRYRVQVGDTFVTAPPSIVTALLDED